jgi:phosphoglycerate dehydrogenase-like enzyme
MQILMSDAAYRRVGGALAAMGEDLDVVTLDPDGVFHHAGAAIPAAEVDPEVFWMSLDLYKTGPMPLFFGTLLGGSRGRWIQVPAAGLDNPIFKKLMAKGLRLTKSTAQAPPIAEYVMAHALSILHPIAEQARLQAAHAWRVVEFREIAQTRWLMLGFGAIGTAIAERLAPFGAPLTVVRRHTAPEPLTAAVRPTSELLAALPDADVVILACALNEETRGVAGEAFFQAMKPGALLINIARGALVDEAALKAGLDRDQPAMAVLDVFATEPLPEDSWFWAHPKVRVTAHGSNAGDGLAARGDLLFLENLKRYRAGEPLIAEADRSEVGL